MSAMSHNGYGHGLGGGQHATAVPVQPNVMYQLSRCNTGPMTLFLNASVGICRAGVTVHHVRMIIIHRCGGAGSIVPVQPHQRAHLVTDVLIV